MPAKEKDIRPVFLCIEDRDEVAPASDPSPSVLNHLRYVKRGLHSLHPGTPSSSVKKTGEKIRDIITSGDIPAQSTLFTPRYPKL